MKQERKLNWKPDLPDHRDYKYEQHSEFLTATLLPSKVDLRPVQCPVVDQGQIGSCTGNAIAGNLGCLEVKELKYHIPTSEAPEEFDPTKFVPISRLFIYANERIMEGTPLSQDSGAAIRDGIMSVRSYGFCSEITWPYSNHNAFVKPSAAAYQEAQAHKELNGYRIDNTNMLSMKTCLAKGYPFVFGISVYSNFMDTGSDGMVEMPSGQMEGGHAILCVGYDDSKHCFIVKNSWGTSWGDNGYCYIPYSYLNDSDLCDDCWTLRRKVATVI